jgi:hypothetical protein
METPKPTIGRIVHYFEKMPMSGELVTMPAVINGVHADGTFVDLYVLGRVRIGQRDRVPYGKTPADGFWTWPAR